MQGPQAENRFLSLSRLIVRYLILWEAGAAVIYDKGRGNHGLASSHLFTTFYADVYIFSASGAGKGTYRVHIRHQVS